MTKNTGATIFPRLDNLTRGLAFVDTSTGPTRLTEGLNRFFLVLSCVYICNFSIETSVLTRLDCRSMLIHRIALLQPHSELHVYARENSAL